MPGYKTNRALSIVTVFFFFLFRYPAVYGRPLEPPISPYLETRKLACFCVLVYSHRLHPKIGGQFLNREDILFWHGIHPFIDNRFISIILFSI